MKVNNERLKDNINTLEKSHDWPVGLVEKLSRFISDGNDYDLFRVNPLQFADEHHISSSDGIDLFLWATKLNLFQMNWELLCPVCGDHIQSFRHLNTMHDKIFCSLCQCEQTASLDDWIQVTFTVNPKIRAIKFHEPESLSIEDLMEYVKGPDFPTSGFILGKSGIVTAYKTGKGGIVMRAKVEVISNDNARDKIIITEIPYQVNKSLLLEKIGELVRSKTIEGISDLRDESDRNGMRIVIDIKKDTQGDVVLNQLWKHTRLQSTFSINMLALDNGQPKQMNLKDILLSFNKFKQEVVLNRTKFLLNKARDRAHILTGLLVALKNIDEIIKIIRGSKDGEEAKLELCNKSWKANNIEKYIELIDDPNNKVIDGTYKLSELQAKAILDLRLQRLTGLESEKITLEINELSDNINQYLSIISDNDVLKKLIISEFDEAINKLNYERKTTITDSYVDQDDEDLIQKEDMVVTVSHRGYIKRVPLSTYKAQRRGGKGRSGMKMRDEDMVTSLFVTDTHTPILFFTSKGMVYQLKCHKLPIAAPQALGKAMINLLPIDTTEKIQTVMPMPSEKDSWNDLQILFATKNGNVRRNQLNDFVNIRQNGKIAMKLHNDDELVSVLPCNATDNFFLASRLGKAIRCDINDVRIFVGRDSSGVRGIKLKPNDYVVSMSIVNPDIKQYVLSVTENGFGKRTIVDDYRITNRGGQGVANIECSDRNGPVVSSYIVSSDDEIMLVTNVGKLIRLKVHENDSNSIRVTGRKTQGVKLFDVSEEEKVVSVALLLDNDDDAE